MFGVALREPRHNAPGTQTLPDRLQRHSHGRPIRCQDDALGVPALLASLGWRQPVRGLAASRYDWLRSVEWQEELPGRRRLDGACCPALPDQ